MTPAECLALCVDDRDIAEACEWAFADGMLSEDVWVAINAKAEEFAAARIREQCRD